MAHTRFISLSIATVVAGLLGPPAPAYAAKNVALVISNEVYDGGAQRFVANVRPDELVRRVVAHGYAVIHGTNVSSSEFEAKSREFGEALKGADSALLYFLGFGVHDGSTAYFVPVGGEATGGSLDVQALLDMMRRESRVSMAVLDAFASSRPRTTRGQPGLGRIRAGDNQLLLTNDVVHLVANGEQRAHLTDAFVPHLGKPDFAPVRVAALTRDDVIFETSGLFRPIVRGAYVPARLPAPPVDKPQDTAALKQEAAGLLADSGCRSDDSPSNDGSEPAALLQMAAASYEGDGKSNGRPPVLDDRMFLEWVIKRIDDSVRRGEKCIFPKKRDTAKPPPAVVKATPPDTPAPRRQPPKVAQPDPPADPPPTKRQAPKVAQPDPPPEPPARRVVQAPSPPPQRAAPQQQQQQQRAAPAAPSRGNSGGAFNVPSF